MEDKKDTSKTTELKFEKQNGKVKKEWTVKRILTTIIIAILAMLMVGGSFYYVFSPGFSKNSSAFGFYDGEPILYENNNIFARTLASDEDYVNAYSSGNYTGIYSSWYKAYQSQVAFIALSQMAKKANILAPRELVNKFIINSGAFNNENGEFDETVYNSTSDADKRYYYSYMKSTYPFQVVVSDVCKALTSAQESAFVTELGTDARTFEYFVVGANVYPDNVTKDYVNENKDFFKIVDVNMISCTTEESAKACYDELKAGLAWGEAVTKYSSDSYASNNGYIGYSIFAGVYGKNMKDATQISKLTVLKEGEYSEPIEGPYAWVIYQANKDAVDADLTDADILTQAKQIIYSEDPEVMKDYLDDAVSHATEHAKHDFEGAAEECGTGLFTVGPAVNNPADSSVLYGMENYDSIGVLAEAAEADEELNKTLYNEAVGYIAGPIEVEDGYLFVKVTAESKEESLGQLTQAMYSYYANQFDVIDFENAILSSDKHTDKFVEKFLQMFF